ncbi:MAG: excinuclease ABC subunit UvrC [Methanobacterium sp.]
MITLAQQNHPEDLPDKPGIYLMRDAKDKVLYVGKAKSLKKRVRSYFKDELDSPKTTAMMRQFHNLEYIITDTEKEALILESNLIKKYLPRYNIRLKDDKRYPYIKITKEDYPRILITRRISDDDSYYYGPFTDVYALKRMLKFIKSLFKIRECKNMNGPCLNYQINLCEAPCDNKISIKDYQQLVDKANLFFQGKYNDIMSIQKKMMTEAAENQEFEKATVLRDQIDSIKGILERQNMEFNRQLEQDVIACSLNEDFATVVVFSVRDGKITGKNDFLMSFVEPTSPEKVLSAFLKQYYTGPRQIPSDLILQYHPDDESLIIDWLKEKSDTEVTFKVPEEGMEYRLIKMVAKNADVIKNHQKEVKGALLDLKTYLGIPKIPRRIEAFDISNISGKNAVASMVVFEDGAPKKNSYRRYKIETTGPDDYAMMREVLMRRYKKLIHEKEEIENSLLKIVDQPDLIVVDGGKGQLNVALTVLKLLNLTNIPVIGLAKEFEHIFIPDVSTPIILPPNSNALHLLQRIRDEAHRFAINYHKKLRSKMVKDSLIDHINGVGPKRKVNLLKHFGSLEKLRESNVEQISQVKGINHSLALKIYEYIHKT